MHMHACTFTAHSRSQTSAVPYHNTTHALSMPLLSLMCTHVHVSHGRTYARRCNAYARPQASNAACTLCHSQISPSALGSSSKGVGIATRSSTPKQWPRCTCLACAAVRTTSPCAPFCMMNTISIAALAPCACVLVALALPRPDPGLCELRGMVVAATGAGEGMGGHTHLRWKRPLPLLVHPKLRHSRSVMHCPHSRYWLCLQTRHTSVCQGPGARAAPGRSLVSHVWHDARRHLHGAPMVSRVPTHRAAAISGRCTSAATTAGWAASCSWAWVVPKAAAAATFNDAWRFGVVATAVDRGVVVAVGQTHFRRKTPAPLMMHPPAVHVSLDTHTPANKACKFLHTVHAPSAGSQKDPPGGSSKAAGPCRPWHVWQWLLHRQESPAGTVAVPLHTTIAVTVVVSSMDVRSCACALGLACAYMPSSSMPTVLARVAIARHAATTAPRVFALHPRVAIVVRMVTWRKPW